MTPFSADLPRPIGPGAASTTPLRLARLRPDFATLYPGLDPGAWYPAGSVAAYFSSWLVRHPGRRQGSAPLRGLVTAHFEFRGGVPREAPWLAGASPDDRGSPPTE